MTAEGPYVDPAQPTTGTGWLITVTAEAEVIRAGITEPEEPAGPAESSST